MTISENDVLDATAERLLNSYQVRRLSVAFFAASKLLRRSEVAEMLRVSPGRVAALIAPVRHSGGSEMLYPLGEVIRYVATLRGITLGEAFEEIGDLTFSAPTPEPERVGVLRGASARSASRQEVGA